LRGDRSVVPITVDCACAKKLVTKWQSKAAHTIPNMEDTPPEPLQQKIVWLVYKLWSPDNEATLFVLAML
jgi:hypothetical protein